MAYTKLIYHIVMRTHQGTNPINEAYERNLYMFIYGFCKNHQCVLDLKIASNNFMSVNRDLFPNFIKWEQGYCALSYSEADKERVMQYIINQKEHHRKLSVREELISLLQECGVEFDKRYI